MRELPEGWTECPLFDVINLHDSRRIPLNAKQRAERPGIYPYYGANGQVGTIDDYIFDGNFVLLAEDGGYFDDPVKRVAYEASGKFWVNNHAHILEPADGIPLRFLTHALNAMDWMPYVGGSTRLKLTQQGMQRVTLRLPPEPEEARIADKIDSLSARSSAAREELSRVPKLVKHYIEALLERAYDGRLTADWRHERAREAPDCCRVRSIVSEVRYGTSKRCLPNGEGVAVLRIPNVSGGGISLDDLKYAALERRELERLALQDGDLLVIRSNGSPELVGRVSLVTEAERGLAYAGYLIRLRPRRELVRPEYLKLMFDSPQLRRVIEVSARSTSGVHNINSEELSSLSIPLPQLDEQDEVVRRVGTAKVWLEIVQSEQAKASVLLSHLDRAILSKAFRGELVPQDPNDEPAEKLLERIRATRAEQPAARRGRRRRSAAAAE